MMRCLATLFDEVREGRNRTFVVEGGMRDRLEAVMGMLQQVEGRKGSDGLSHGDGEDVERIQEAWQGLYEVFKGMRREIGRMSEGL